MEALIVFIVGILFLVLFARLTGVSERIEKLEEKIEKLRLDHARLLMKGETEETPESEEKPTEPTHFEKAQERAAATGPPETVSRPPEPEAEVEVPEAKPQPLPEAAREAIPEKAAAKPVEPSREEEPLLKWRPILEKVYLWPPTGESAEATIAAWWLTRIGLIVFIIASVFFGIRIAENVPPGLRVLTLAGIAAGVTALGAWLERRLQAFGRMISAGGLALGYFTAFAAFALPATKIIHDPAIGVLVQIVALAIVIAWSLWKRDEAVAAMAILLGYVSCGFSHHHDLDNFVIAGLLMLAAGGGVMLVLRRWTWPHAIATAGSWGGILILALGEWSNAGEAPGFPIILGSLILLTAILEAANCLAEDRCGDDPDSRPHHRKWLAVLNTSAAIAVGWIAVQQVAPDHLATFFLSFALVLLGITTIRFWCGHPIALTETFFLKSIALLALFFVEKFEGPTRWLSLAVEAGAVLWAFRRSRLRWVEIGFGAVFLGALGFVWKDILQAETAGGWELFGIPSFAGAATLVLLSIQLALHSRWSPPADQKKDGESLWNVEPVDIFRTIAAGFTGLAAAVFAVTLSTETPEIAQPVYLSLVALAIAAPVFLIRRFPPVAAGLAALVPAYALFLGADPQLTNAPAIFAAAWLSLLAFGIAELVYRTWPEDWDAGNAIRAVLSALGLLSLANLIFRLEERFELGTAASALAILVFATAGALTLIGMSRRLETGQRMGASTIGHEISQWLIGVLIGGTTLFVSLRFLEDHVYLGAWMAIGAAILFTAAFRTKNLVPAVAGGLPFLGAVGVHAIDFGSNSGLGSHVLSASVLIAVSLGTVLVLWRSVDRDQHPEVRTFELVLQASAIFVIHWIFRSHLTVPGVFLADALLAVAATLSGRLPAFRMLPILSSLPLAFALLHAGVSTLADDWNGRAFWWLAAMVVFGWTWFLYSPSTPKEPALNRPALHFWNSAVAAAFITIAGFHALDAPWHLVVLIGFAVILAGLWRWEKIGGLHAWSILPLGFAAIGMLLRINGTIAVDSADGLIATSLISLGIVGHGIVLAFRNPEYRPLMWAHGFTGLGLVFFAYAPGNLGVSELTTVCWGGAAIALFVIGLATGLRPFRLVGLIGLAFCLGRMFLVDISDPLYRIFAFFAIAIVLLVMGYLYHRFRDLIERADHWKPDSS